MISKKNRHLYIKVSEDVYKFIETLSKKYGVSISNFGEDAIVHHIMELDKRAESNECSSPDAFYKKYSLFVNQTYKSGLRGK